MAIKPQRAGGRVSTLGNFSNGNSNKNQERIFINWQIKAVKVLCIDHNNTNVGVISLSQAISLASANGLDLVQVAPPNKDNPPTCKILDAGKYKFELSKKRKEADKKQRESIIKTHELKFRPNTDVHDLETKAKKAKEFIDDGCRVKVTITFKGREISHQEVAYETLGKFMSFVPELQMIGKPSFDRKDMSVFIGKREVNNNSVKVAS
jgi:translation initiation factor IF-3